VGKPRNNILVFCGATDHKVASVFNVLERNINPQRLSSLTADVLSRHQKMMRDAGPSDSTIKGHLAHLKSALAWAVDKGWLPSVPKVKMPKRAKKAKVMKGRPITTEEFERMLDAVPKVVVGGRVKDERKPEIIASWKFYLWGLWHSGLRLDESMQLDWTDHTKLSVVDLDKPHPMLWIPAECEKGNEDRILPMAPEFAEYLRQVPKHQRTGYVFNPLPRRARYSQRLTSYRVGEVVSDIGRHASVKVDSKSAGGIEKPKYASAHDLRRSFGERWAMKVMPQLLKELMRHESIETTQRYYIGRNAQATASILWESHKVSVGADLGASDEATVDTL